MHRTLCALPIAAGLLALTGCPGLPGAPGAGCIPCCEEYIEVINACKNSAGMTGDGDPAECSEEGYDLLSESVYECRIAIFEDAPCTSEQSYMDTLSSALDCR